MPISVFSCLVKGWCLVENLSLLHKKKNSIIEFSVASKSTVAWKVLLCSEDCRSCLLSKMPVAAQFVTEASGQKAEFIDKCKGKNQGDKWWMSLAWKSNLWVGPDPGSCSGVQLSIASARAGGDTRVVVIPDSMTMEEGHRAGCGAIDQSLTLKHVI